MKTLEDVLARLDGEGVAMVVQLSAKECAEMALVFRRCEALYRAAVDRIELLESGRRCSSCNGAR